jgi:hypothetical protein
MPCSALVAEDNSLVQGGFEEEFRSRLLAQHCFMGSPLFQEGFDSAFISACKEAGHEVGEAPPGQRFWDVMVDDRKISLKSTKAKSLKERFLHISKLTEAAWIQDCRSARQRHERTCELFQAYCDEVDSIIQLRFFDRRQLYELVEIPTVVFRQIFELKVNCFSSESSSINIPVGKEPPDFTLKLDRSDAKITLANINKDQCNLLGTWQLG